MKKDFQTFQKLFSLGTFFKKRFRTSKNFCFVRGTLFEKSVPPTTPSQKLLFCTTPSQKLFFYPFSLFSPLIFPLSTSS
ncbi:MAG: hypothetical protein D6805_04195 [Planctomycetota bacterium]|nr:MAG: hypothetical protein D6805_04195 [Planctomycetota bacterium]